MDFPTLDDLPQDLSGKKIIVRLDLNSPVINGKVQDNERFAASCETIRELSKRGGRVIILAHQSRPEENEFTNLQQHAEILAQNAKKKIKYCDDLFGSAAIAAIEKLGDGKILLLENTRFYSEELLDSSKKKAEDTIIIKTLSKQADYFINEAFSVSHRSQTSVVGFCNILPSFAGRALVKEYDAIKKASENSEKPVIYLVGGAKPPECIKIIGKTLARGQADKILTSGIIGELFLLAKGKKLGAKEKWLDEKKYTSFLPEVKSLLATYGDKIEVPGDFAYSDKDGFRVEILLEELDKTKEPVFDIGSNTAKYYAELIASAKTVYFKGPLGKYEEPAFRLGTSVVLKAMAKSDAFTLIGGGDSGSALEILGFSPRKFGHVSTAGGALLAMLGGEQLPGIEALKNAKRLDVNDPQELLYVVDDNDNEIGKATRRECHEKHLRHRSIGTIIIKDGRIWIKKRSLTKDLNPGLWECHVGGHVAYGESYEDTAKRELKEESGLADDLVFLEKHNADYELEKESVSVFYTVTKQTPKENPEEATESKFVTLPELEEMMNNEKFTLASIKSFDALKKSITEGKIKLGD